ncbi:MAG TPA: hypothetical protein DDW52_25005 [Planctomycetaceae bacterium]|nr:hypothetical protein [Planctomycetaceae bacterium]
MNQDPNEPFFPRCPTCDMRVDLVAAKRYAPFCSERCQLRDLGRWLNEEHALPCDDAEDESEELAAEGGQSTPRLPPGWHDA